jgi:hypothetical protein
VGINTVIDLEGIIKGIFHQDTVGLDRSLLGVGISGRREDVWKGLGW